MGPKLHTFGVRFHLKFDDQKQFLISYSFHHSNYRCAYSNTPKCNQVKGKGKIISKKWIEHCFAEQKRLPWRRFALDSSEMAESESEEEIYVDWLKPKTSDEQEQEKIDDEKMEEDEDDDDDDMVIVVKQKSPPKVVVNDSDSDDDMKMVVINKKDDNIKNDSDEGVKDIEDSSNGNSNNNNLLNTSGSQEREYSEDSVSSIDITQVECQIFRDKVFYLNEDLSATDKIKLPDMIKSMVGTVTKNPFKASYIITKEGRSLPRKFTGEVVKEIWVRECCDLQAFIPTKRYKLS